jgi:hypothetical protein
MVDAGIDVQLCNRISKNFSSSELSVTTHGLCGERDNFTEYLKLSVSTTSTL